VVLKKFKKQKEEKDFSFLIFFFSLFLIFFLAISIINIEKKRKTLENEIENLKFNIQVLEEKKKKLEEAISQSEKGNYWEEKIREEGYVREGEEAIVIKRIEGEREKKNESETFWQKIFGELKNILKR
jgi:cell division protein FtsB